MYGRKMEKQADEAAEAANDQLKDMLNLPPDLSSSYSGIATNWRLMRPISLEQLQMFWNLVEERDTPMINTEDTEYAEW